MNVRRPKPRRWAGWVAAGFALALGGVVRVVAADWVKLTAPGFTIVSEVSEARTRAWAGEFELFRRGISQLLPLEPGRLQPVSMVLFASAGRLTPFKPLENGKPARIDGYFVRMPGRNVIAISVDGARDATRARIFHEATHWYLAGFDGSLPMWLEEGLGEVFGTFSLQGEAFLVGAARPDYIRTLRAGKAPPFAQLMTRRGGSLHYNGQHADEAVQFYAQSWAAAHLLLLGEDGRNLPALREFLQRAGTGAEPIAEFAAAFQLSPAEMDARLASYLERRALPAFRASLDRGAVEAGFKVEPASAADVDLALGGLLIGVDRAGEAKSYFARAAAARPDEPRVATGQGEIELAAGHPAEALAKFNEAVARGADGFHVRYLAAMAGLRALQTPGPTATIAADHYAEIWQNLAAAQRQNPRFLPVYELAGLALAVPLAAGTAEPGAMLREGLARFPRSPAIQLGLGFLAVRQGNAADAAACARRATEGMTASTIPLGGALRLLEAEISRRGK